MGLSSSRTLRLQPKKLSTEWLPPESFNSHPLRRENVSRISPHHSGRSALASIEPDEDSERGFSGTHRERKSQRAALAVSGKKRGHAAQTYPAGGILFRARRNGPPARGRRDVDRAAP